MSDEHLNILHYLYIKTAPEGFVKMREMEVQLGYSADFLRSRLEDLKEAELALEFSEGFRLSGAGINHARTLWI